MATFLEPLEQADADLDVDLDRAIVTAVRRYIDRGGAPERAGQLVMTWPRRLYVATKQAEINKETPR